MENSHSGRHSEDIPSPQRTAAGSNIQGDYSGNISSNNTINSGNTTHNNYYHGGSDGSPERYAEIMQCLYTSKYEEHRDRVREPVEGTCTWVTKHPKYEDWLEKKSSGVLWLSADPGCGKSVIASFLINHLETHTDAIVCYFFFKDDSDEQGSAQFALCAILHQLFLKRTSLSVFAQEMLQAKGKRFIEEVTALWGILIKAVTDGGCGDVICVVDALDECEEQTRDQFIRSIIGLSRSRTPDMPLKFLVTGRPYHRIERALGAPATTIRLKGEEEVNAITADVNLVIDEGITNLESYWGQPGGLGSLRNLLESCADRTFLWVSLVLEILKDSEDGSVEEFTNIVSTTPRDIAELYTKILNKSRFPDKARQILNIVVAAARPLTLLEMHAAFKIKREHKSVKDLGDFPAGFDRSLKNWCGLFIRVIDSKIYLVHQTAREFLIKGSLSGLGNWQYTICPRDSNFLLADICISYLSLEDFENDPLVIDQSSEILNNLKCVRYLQKHSLLDYAARYWARHFRDSQTRQMELFQFTRLICQGGSGRLLTWITVYWPHNRFGFWIPYHFTHLMMASWLGQVAVVEQLLQEGGDIDARYGKYGTALNVAAFGRREDIVRMLLQSNAKAYIRGKEYNVLQTKRSELLSQRGVDGVEGRFFWGPTVDYLVFLALSLGLRLFISESPIIERILNRFEEEMMEWTKKRIRELGEESFYANYVIDFLAPFCIQDTPDPHTLDNQGTASS